MAANADPLATLKNVLKARGNISYSADSSELVIGDVSFPKTTPTRYRKAGALADFYSLEAVYLAWVLRDATGAEYMKQAREKGLTVGFVSVTERKHVVDWLDGKTSDQDRIAPLTTESTTPPSTPPRPTGQGLTTTPRTRAEAPTSSPTKRRYIADAHDLEVVKKIRLNEVELKDRNAVLRGTKPNNFSAVRTAYNDKLKKLKESSRSGTAPTATAPAADPKMLARKARHNQPIIIISSSPTSLITMHNVKKFLEDSTFETSQDARARATSEGNTRPEDLIAIYRKKTTIDTSGKETTIKSTYFVVDSVEALNKFGPDCWDRVVCVMTTGQAWQFRPYKWSEPRQLFHNVKGIYVSWSNDPPNPKIKDWNVTELKVDPNRRHVDKSVVAHFWKLLDTWIQANKPWLVKT
ncbi:RNA pol II accessory factor, Cdc73 family-domain-containing protein [Crepidotus variabilis]|uniref:RNA pol II accessory factor, Cdc73 family-domain-containing protein n=1 Tax=Crepidotus variabilis TaxID=179855 RepID=A0A9P6EEW1_9AGAR|nr:RNA pol II accessory factor, Cdc73 family-domain-containing protein [Crepidotus variabilis]